MDCGTMTKMCQHMKYMHSVPRNNVHTVCHLLHWSNIILYNLLIILKTFMKFMRSSVIESIYYSACLRPTLTPLEVNKIVHIFFKFTLK